MTPTQQLQSGIQALGLDLSAEQQTLLLAYTGLLKKWNKTYNLTALRDEAQMVSHHLLDSLTLLPYLQGAQTMLDVGSGGGQPGIPAAICRPDLNITLLDANTKKTAFLQQAVIELGLSNVRVVSGRVEAVQDLQADIITSRAFAELADFVNWTAHLLKDGGRAAVVLPDGFLFGEGIKSRIKEKLLTECNLHTIVRLPNGVFNPYTGIKTNLLFFTKGTPTKEVWFYEHQYPAGVKNYSKTRPMRIEEFAVEEAWWGSETDGFAARVENEFAWKVSLDELKARNWNLDCKNPHVGEQISHDPDQLLRDYAQLQGEISELRDQLKAVLAEALERP